MEEKETEQRPIYLDEWIEWAESGRWFMVWRENWPTLFCWRPDLILKWPQERLEGIDWAAAVCNDLTLKERCPYDLFDGECWVICLCAHPGVFDEKCDWSALEFDNWAKLLIERPECFRPEAKEKLQVQDRVEIIAKHPSLAGALGFEELPYLKRLSVVAETTELDGRMDWSGLGRRVYNHEQPGFAFAWSYLLSKRPEFAEKCTCWEWFDVNDWLRLVSSQRCFDDHCPWDKIPCDTFYDWKGLVLKRPDLAERCPWDIMTEADAEDILAEHPEWGSRFPERLQSVGLEKEPSFLESQPCDPTPIPPTTGNEWAEYLTEHPDEAAKCPFESFDGDDWRWMLARHPEFAEKCDWEKLDGTNWAQLLMFQPQFGERCPWEKLGGDDWGNLVDKRPEFAWRCPRRFRSGPKWLWKARIEWSGHEFTLGDDEPSESPPGQGIFVEEPIT